VDEKFLEVMLSSFVNLKGHDESTMEDVNFQDDLATKLVHTLF